MATPRNVKKQANEAKELQKALNTEPAVVIPVKEPTDELEQPAAAAAKEDLIKDQPVIPAVGEEPKVDETEWEKRYKGLQKRYNREVPELRGQLSAAEGTVNSLQKDVDELKVSIQNVVPQKAALEEVTFSDEEIEQYGEGYIEMMKKIAQQSQGEMAKQIVDLQTQLANVKQGVTQVRETVVVNNERDFRSELARMVKSETGRDWLEINEDDGFHNFLAETVQYTNTEKQEYLAKAHREFDVDAAAKFFIDYAGSSSSQTESLIVVPEVPEELITPASSGGGNIPLAAEERVYTTDEVDQFYADKRTGKYKGKEDEARKIEKDILVAGKAGRIVKQRAYAHA